MAKLLSRFMCHVFDMGAAEQHVLRASDYKKKSRQPDETVVQVRWRMMVEDGEFYGNLEEQMVSSSARNMSVGGAGIASGALAHYQR